MPVKAPKLKVAATRKTTTRDMHIAIGALAHEWGGKTAMGYRPLSWFECDYLRIAPDGTPEEFEIKLTVGSLWAEWKKGNRLGNKQARLWTGDGWPAKFWFVAPKWVCDRVAENIPVWAGLICVTGHKKSAVATVVKEASMLHRNKVCPHEFQRTAIGIGPRPPGYMQFQMKPEFIAPPP